MKKIYFNDSNYISVYINKHQTFSNSKENIIIAFILITVYAQKTNLQTILFDIVLTIIPQGINIFNCRSDCNVSLKDSTSNPENCTLL